MAATINPTASSSSSSSSPSTADYWVGPIVGTGSFGHVLYGRHKMNGAVVAIKVMEQWPLRKHPGMLQVVLHEQRMLQQLTIQHQYEEETGRNAPFPVVQLLASFHDSQCVYLVLEWIDGLDLQIWMTQDDELWQKNGHISYYYLAQIVLTIHELHTYCQVVHCDLKPANIMVSTVDGRVTLIDLASAWSLKKNDEGSSSSSMDMPRGTPAYSSPELLSVLHPHRHDAVETKVVFSTALDYWSVGCLWYAMHDQPAHQSPFLKESMELTIQSVLEWEQDPWSSLHLPPFCDEERLEEESTQYPSETVLRGLLSPTTSVQQRAESWNELVSWSSHYLKSRDGTAILKPSSRPPIDESELNDGTDGWSAFLL